MDVITSIREHLTIDEANALRWFILIALAVAIKFIQHRQSANDNQA